MNGLTSRYDRLLAKQRADFTLALKRARCPKDGGHILEVQMPDVICEECSTKFTLAIQSGTFLMRTRLIEKKDDHQTMARIPQAPLSARAYPPATQTPGSLFCMNCGTSLPLGSRFCNSCGTPTVQPSPPPQPQPQTQPTPSPLHCNYCGQLLQSSDKYCPKCGQWST
jgi:hypothetical protein